jgi:hypothetical protein
MGYTIEEQDLPKEPFSEEKLVSPIQNIGM